MPVPRTAQGLAKQEQRKNAAPQQQQQSDEEEEEEMVIDENDHNDDEEEYDEEFAEEEEAAEEEEDDDDDSDSDDDDEDEDEEDEDLGPDPIHITVQLNDSDNCKILHFRNEVTFPEFKAAVATAWGLDPKSKFIISRKRKTKPPQQIMTKNHFDYMVDSYFEHNDQFLRIILTPAAATTANSSNNVSMNNTTTTNNNNTINNNTINMMKSTTLNNNNNNNNNGTTHQLTLNTLGGTVVNDNNSNAIHVRPMSATTTTTTLNANQQQQHQQMVASNSNSGGMMMMATIGAGGASSSSQSMPPTIGGASVRPSTSMSMSGTSSGGTEADQVQAIFESGQFITVTDMKTLGTGAYGKVCEAITNGGHLLAVKHLIFPASQGDASKLEKEATQLVEEIRLMKNLHHKNIVKYYGSQTKQLEDGSRAIDVFMEVCHGGSLASMRKKVDPQRGRMPVGLVRNYIRQVLEGLSYLHLKQIVHRDIKADNVLLTSAGFAKLADFGCSKKLGGASFESTFELELRHEDSSPSASGSNYNNTSSKPNHNPANNNMAKTLVGTPLFIAPEVLTESSDGYLQSADIWSIGCLVIELFGKKPWKLQNTSVFTVMFAIAQAKTLPTGMPDVKIDPKLFDFLSKCFQRDPALRPTARALLEHPWMTCSDVELEEPIWSEDTTPNATAPGTSASIRQ